MLYSIKRESRIVLSGSWPRELLRNLDVTISSFVESAFDELPDGEK